MKNRGVRIAALAAIAATVGWGPLIVRGQSGPGVPVAAAVEAINKARISTRILYITAHPDDEDAGLLAYLSRGLYADVAMLTLTRGQGGQKCDWPRAGWPAGCDSHDRAARCWEPLRRASVFHDGCRYGIFKEPRVDDGYLGRQRTDGRHGARHSHLSSAGSHQRLGRRASWSWPAPDERHSDAARRGCRSRPDEISGTDSRRSQRVESAA